MEIYKSLIGVMRDLTPIVSSKKHQQGWKYRGVEDIYNNLHPLLAQHGIVTIPIVISVDRTLIESSAGKILYHVMARVEYRFYTDDGSYVSCVSAGEGVDSLDNATAKALTDAHTKALVQTFLIPTEEVKKSPQVDFLQRSGIDIGANGTAYKAALSFYAADSIDEIPIHRMSNFVEKLQSFQKGHQKTQVEVKPEPQNGELPAHIKDNINRDRLLAVATELGCNGAACKAAIEFRYPGKLSEELSESECNFAIQILLSQWALSIGFADGDATECSKRLSKWLLAEKFKIGETKDSFLAAAWCAHVSGWIAARSN